MADPDPEVGYGKPPRRTQFKPGQSGNPSGRRKPKPSFSEQLDRILAEKVPVTQGGSSTKIAREEAFLRQTFNRAMAGDRQCHAAIFNYLQRRQAATGDADRGALDDFLMRELIAIFGKSKPEPDG